MESTYLITRGLNANKISETRGARTPACRTVNHMAARTNNPIKKPRILNRKSLSNPKLIQVRSNNDAKMGDESYSRFCQISAIEGFAARFTLLVSSRQRAPAFPRTVK